MATELLVLFSGNAVAEAAGAVLVLGTPLIGWRRLRLREGYLLCLCAALFALALAYDPEPWALALRGLDRPAFLAAFILLMALLREGGITSPAVLTCGPYVAHQPPPWRFLATSLAIPCFSVSINHCTLILLAPLTHRGVRGASLPPPT